MLPRLTAPSRKLRPFPLAAAIHALFLAGAAIGAQDITAPAAHAQTVDTTQAKRQYAVPAGPLERTLTTFASTAGVELSADAALLQGKRSGGLAGSCTVRQGFEELLRGQGVRVVAGANVAKTRFADSDIHRIESRFAPENSPHKLAQVELAKTWAVRKQAMPT